MRWASRSQVGALAAGLVLIPGVARSQSFQLVWQSPPSYYCFASAWGDWDGDLNMDIAVAGSDGTGPTYKGDKIFSKSGSTLTQVWESAERDETHAVAWGDWDGDFDLDLATSSHPSPGTPGDNSARIYLNDGSTLTLAWQAVITTVGVLRTDIAWGDFDGDLDLDILTASGDATTIYRNDGAAGVDLAGTASCRVSWSDRHGSVPGDTSAPLVPRRRCADDGTAVLPCVLGV